jgi:hypothetical protein
MITDEIISEAFNLFDETSDKSSPSSKYDSIARTWPLRLTNTGYQEVCRETKCSRTSDTFNTVANQREYAYPTDFVAVHSLDYNGNYRLNPVSYQRIDKDFSLNSTGVPIQYYLAADKLGIVPIPNTVYLINRMYFNSPAVDLILTESPTLVPTKYHYVISYYVTMKLFEVDKGADSNRAIMWKRMYEEELAKMRVYFSSGMNADRKPEI